MVERQCRRDLEERRAEPFALFLPTLDERQNFVFADLFTIDNDAFAKIDEVRRRVPPDSQALLLCTQQCIESGDDASLSVRSGDVKGCDSFVRVTEQRQESSRALEAEIGSAAGAREESVERAFVARQAAVHPVAAGLPLM